MCWRTSRKRAVFPLTALPLLFCYVEQYNEKGRNLIVHVNFCVYGVGEWKFPKTIELPTLKYQEISNVVKQQPKIDKNISRHFNL